MSSSNSQILSLFGKIYIFSAVYNSIAHWRLYSNKSEQISSSQFKMFKSIGNFLLLSLNELKTLKFFSILSV